MTEKNRLSWLGTVLVGAIVLTGCQKDTTVSRENTTTTQQPSQTAQAPDQQAGEMAKQEETGSLKIVSAEQSVKPGDEVTIRVQTTPKTKVKIEADGAAMTDAMALMDKTADDNGFAEWKFNLDKNYKADKLPVILTADYDGLDRKVVQAIEVQLPADKKPNFDTELSNAGRSARLGEEITLAVKTAPNADVKLDAKGLGFELGAGSKKADKDGKVSWKIKIDQDYKADQVPIIITSKLNNKEAKEVTSIKLEQIAYQGGDKNL